jgi:hypothetical protein
MKSLILVSKTDIVIKIFSLVCKKLSITFDVYDRAEFEQKVDIIVVEKEFVNDEFNFLKTYTKLLGVISNDELGFEVANDFTTISFFAIYVRKYFTRANINFKQKSSNKKLCNTYRTTHRQYPNIY